VSNAQLLRLELSPSPGLAATILTVHAAAAAAFLTSMTAWAGIALALLTLSLGVAAAWDRALLRAARSARVIEISSGGEARCLFADGASANVQPLRGSAVTRYWVALGLRSRRRRSLFVTAGMLAPDAMRRLRIWALWGRLPRVAPRQLLA
jgi:hypothetical protein